MRLRQCAARALPGGRRRFLQPEAGGRGRCQRGHHRWVAENSCTPSNRHNAALPRPAPHPPSWHQLTGVEPSGTFHFHFSSGTGMSCSASGDGCTHVVQIMVHGSVPRSDYCNQCSARRCRDGCAPSWLRIRGAPPWAAHALQTGTVVVGVPLSAAACPEAATDVVGQVLIAPTTRASSRRLPDSGHAGHDQGGQVAPLQSRR